MTENEIRDKFNLHYNNIISSAAPGLDDYEISLYLTQSHKEVIHKLYNETPKGDSYDTTQKLKTILSTYTRFIQLSITNLLKTEFDLYNYVVDIPDYIWHPLAESVIASNGTRPILVKPIDYDNYYVLVENPHKRPNFSRAWRLDISTDNIRQVRLISDRTLELYNVDYLIRPEPIIIGNFDDIMSGLSIEGKNSTFIPTSIDVYLWELVINRAVELATRDYEEDSLQAQIQTNAE